MTTRSPMTRKGYDAMSEEVRHLKLVERPAAAKAIGIAREHGDLSENAEYHAAKEHQGMLEARIKVLESKLSTAQVVDISKLSGTKVVFGATVTLEDVDSGEERRITIVGDEETDIDNGLISYQSPVARALIGKELDDIVKVVLPSGAKEYEIRDVQFIELS